MAGSGLLSLLDDISALLDDVATMTKVATKKTAGVLGDDLALNAQQVVGVSPDRELPVVWAVARGSAKNKLILVPSALVISLVAPWAVLPLLMVGGAFLCYEGVEKVLHKLLHRREEAEARRELAAALADPSVDVVVHERDKVKGAVRTDFILSAEIIVITLGTVAGASFGKQVAVLVAISVLMTVGVYGLVAGIVKLDDAGLALSRRASRAARAAGATLLRTVPYLMKGLSIAGTAAMFLVGGGILVHGIPGLEEAIAEVGGATGLPGFLISPLASGLTGVLAGGVALAAVAGVQRVWPRRARKAAAPPPPEERPPRRAAG